jgi:hypothetical protein
VRLLVVGIWLACALLGALCTIRLTGNLPLGLAVLALTSAHLRALAYEPGHPGGLCMLLVMLLATTVTFFAERRRALICGILGALVGCLLMTKMNIGVFALLALALTLSSAISGAAGGSGSSGDEHRDPHSAGDPDARARPGGFGISAGAVRNAGDGAGRSPALDGRGQAGPAHSRRRVCRDRWHRSGSRERYRRRRSRHVAPRGGTESTAAGDQVPYDLSGASAHRWKQRAFGP